MRKMMMTLCMTVAMTAVPALAADWPAAGQPGSLEWAMAGSWREPKDLSRDAVRHPAEELKFMGLQPGMSVVWVQTTYSYNPVVGANYVPAIMSIW